MIGDGFGPTSVTFGRVANGNRPLHLDSIFVGTSRTYSSSSVVTDSAAGATAFACGLKTYNYAIGVDSNGAPCGTLMEAALQQRNMRVGLVALNMVTDATPAAFSAHVLQRSQQSQIAEQQIKELHRKFAPPGKTWGLDVLLGGGRCQFTPSTTPASCRTDAIDLIQDATTNYKYQYAETREQLQTLNRLPALGLFSNGNMKFSIDRLPDNLETEPTLKEMTIKALELLQKDNPNGFFLMVEGSRIDHAAHNNDPAAHIRDILAYDEAVKVVLDFAKADGNTLVVSTADHETGGLTLGRDIDGNVDYIYYVNKALAMTGSTEVLGAEIFNGGDVASTMIKYGLDNPTAAEISLITNATNTAKEKMFAVSDVLSRRVRVGWSTRGHTGIDVNVYAYGPQSTLFYGNQENTDLGNKVAQIFGLNLQSITRQLNP